MSLRSTGRLPRGKYLERLKQSPNYTAKGFRNLSETPMIAEDTSYWKMVLEFFNKNRNTVPPVTLPSVKTDLHSLRSDLPVIIWFGHSSYFIRIAGKNILVDLVFSGNAAPLSFMVKAFPGSDIYTAEDMPPIDYLILTHDHYDHLDYKTVSKLKKKVSRVYCSLGIGAHLLYWGFAPDIITEMDWWDDTRPGNQLTLVAVPARHFSGRGIKRFQSLWSSFVLKSSDHSIFIGGDSGYDTHFKEIGDRYGPFDVALLEAGQYNVQWPHIHMMPEETVQAAKDLRAKTLLPVHWGKFTLAMHAWNEPVERIMAKAEELHVEVITPLIGEPVVVGEKNVSNTWWKL